MQSMDASSKARAWCADGSHQWRSCWRFPCAVCMLQLSTMGRNLADHKWGAALTIVCQQKMH